MARYGNDYGRNYGRDFDRWPGGGGQGWSERGGWSGSRGDMGGISGMHTGGGPGSESGYGEGYGGGGFGYDAGYGYGGGGMGGAGGTMGGRFFGAGGGGYARDFMGGSGYGGRDMGYGGGYGSGMSGGYGMGEMGRGGGRGMGRGRTRAADLMTENPECVTPDASLADVARRMRDLDVGIIPVVESMENRRLRGVITDRDIAIRAVAEGKDGKAKVSDCMTTRVETVNKNDSADEVMSLMGREQVRRVPVTDREGRLVGIIAQADLALDYGEGNPRQEARVEQTIERISEPDRSSRGSANSGTTGMAARGRKGTETD